MIFWILFALAGVAKVVDTILNRLGEAAEKSASVESDLSSRYDSNGNTL